MADEKPPGPPPEPQKKPRELPPGFTGWPPEPPAPAPAAPAQASPPPAAAPAAAPSPAAAPAPPSPWALVGKILTAFFLVLAAAAAYYGYRAYAVFRQMKELAAVPGLAQGLSRPEAPTSAPALPLSGGAASSSLVPILSSTAAGLGAPDSVVPTPRIEDIAAAAGQIKRQDAALGMVNMMLDSPLFKVLRQDPQFDAAFQEAMKPGGNPMAALALMSDPKMKEKFKKRLGTPEFQKQMMDYMNAPAVKQMTSQMGLPSPALPPASAGLAPIESRPVAPQLAAPGAVNLQELKAHEPQSGGAPAPGPSQ